MESRRATFRMNSRGHALGTPPPGGRPPPAPGQAPGDPNPWHEYANARQALEERGVPLPDKFDPRKRLQQMQRDARLLEVLDPEQRQRIAPPPREAKPKPPGR
ncbi:MAG: hypothetical protein K2X82_22965 [Gemmataceae bacterium]|nr:hypothetical protein [Gemmataceae bacterium]